MTTAISGVKKSFAELHNSFMATLFKLFQCADTSPCSCMSIDAMGGGGGGSMGGGGGKGRLGGRLSGTLATYYVPLQNYSVALQCSTARLRVGGSEWLGPQYLIKGWVGGGGGESDVLVLNIIIHRPVYVMVMVRGGEGTAAESCHRVANI